MDHFNAMFEDKKTKSWWQQATGVCVAGPEKGAHLTEIPSQQSELGEWLAQYPHTKVLQPDTAFQKHYDGLADYDKVDDQQRPGKARYRFLEDEVLGRGRYCRPPGKSIRLECVGEPSPDPGFFGLVAHHTGGSPRLYGFPGMEPEGKWADAQLRAQRNQPEGYEYQLSLELERHVHRWALERSAIATRPGLPGVLAFVAQFPSPNGSILKGVF